MANCPRLRGARSAGKTTLAPLCDAPPVLDMMRIFGYRCRSGKQDAPKPPRRRLALDGAGASAAEALAGVAAVHRLSWPKQLNQRALLIAP